MRRKRKPADPKEVEIVHQDYQPSKAELEEPITFPPGTTVDDLVRAIVQPVNVRFIRSPRRDR